MKSFTGMPNTEGINHPLIVPKGDTFPGDKLGTPLLAWWLKEVFGFLQASMNGASIIPSGDADVAGSTDGDIEDCQVLQAIQVMFATPGEIVGFPSDAIPTGARLLPLEGQDIAVADYPRLISAVYCGNTANATAPAFFRHTGMVRSTSGTSMRLPDYRGMFLRGRDASAAIDPDGATREYGDTQKDAIDNHTHTGVYIAEGVGVDTEVTAVTADDGSSTTRMFAVGSPSGDSLVTGSVTTATADTANETRPTNTVVRWCIRY